MVEFMKLITDKQWKDLHPGDVLIQHAGRRGWNILVILFIKTTEPGLKVDAVMTNIEAQITKFVVFGVGAHLSPARYDETFLISANSVFDAVR